MPSWIHLFADGRWQPVNLAQGGHDRPKGEHSAGIAEQMEQEIELIVSCDGSPHA